MRGFTPGQMAVLSVLLALGGAMLATSARLLIVPVTIPEINALLLPATMLAATASFIHGWITFSLRGAIVFFALSAVCGLVAEIVGGRLPVFGATYEYAPGLGPRIFGVVPVFVPLAWFFLSFQSLAVLRPLLRSRAMPAALRAAACASLLTAFDLLLDPLATALGLWRWDEAGALFGVPALNSAGWFATGLCIFSLVFRLVKARPPEHHTAFARAVDILSALMTGLTTLVLIGVAMRVMRPSAYPAIMLIMTVPPWLVWMKHLLINRRL